MAVQWKKEPAGVATGKGIVRQGYRFCRLTPVVLFMCDAQAIDGLCKTLARRRKRQHESDLSKWRERKVLEHIYAVD